ncbi:MAG: LCP family protein [Candidatus Nanopelagicales bacterium]
MSDRTTPPAGEPSGEPDVPADGSPLADTPPAGLPPVPPAPGLPAPGPDATPAPGPGLHATVLPRRRRWPRVVLASLSVVVLMATVAGAGYAAMYTKLQGNVRVLDISNQVGSDRPVPQVVDEQGNYTPVTVLLMGSDSRQGKGNQGYGNPDVYGGERSDTTILLHLSADRSRAIAVSIPRDTWVTLPECESRTTPGETVGGYEQKFNVAFELGGPGCTVKLVEEMTGLTIDHFAVIDFGGFKRVIDAMGGVEVCLTTAVDDDKSGLVLPAGTSVVSGEDALAFVRARKTLGDGSDLSRIKRQQEFLSSLIRKASSTEMLLNPVKLYGVLDAATQSLTTDPQLANLDNMRDLVLSAKDMKPKQISFVTVPWLPRGDNVNVVIDEEKAAPLWQAIANDTPWPPKKTSSQPALKTPPQSISVRVLNGSGVEGQATKAAEALTAAGFNVVEVGNADRNDYATSVVQHDPGYDESGRTLTYAVKGATSEAVDGLGSVLTVVIGQNYTTVRPVVIDGSSTGDVEATTADTVSCSS